MPGGVSHVAEANGFVNFELNFDAAQGRRVVGPRNYVVVFNTAGNKKQKYHSSLLTLRLTPEENLPEQVQVGVEVRGHDGESVICSGEYVEFELLSGVNDASRQPPLRIAAGPVRVNADNNQREFMRINLGRCVRQIVTDIVDDPKHKGQKLVRSRWWICVEVLRLVCTANSLDCGALDKPGCPALEWVICLVDDRDAPPPSRGHPPAGSETSSNPAPAGAGAAASVRAPGNARASASTSGATSAKTAPVQDRTIEELANFIDAGSKKAKAKKKKKSQAASSNDCVEEEEPDAAVEPTGPGSAAPSLSEQLSEQLSEAMANCTTGASAASSLLAAQLAAQLKPCLGAALTGSRLPAAAAAAAAAALSQDSAGAAGPTGPPGGGASASAMHRGGTAGDEVRQPSRGSNSVAAVPGGAALSRPSPPPGWSRTVDLSPSLVTAWRDVAGRDVCHVAEASGFVHFVLSLSTEGSQRLVAPQHYAVAFPTTSAGQQRYHSALLNLRIVETGKDCGESVEFELLSRPKEAPSQTPLRFTAGPVRVNSKTGQRESMRLDLGTWVHWAEPDQVEGRLDGRAQRLQRQRWWVAIETLRLICYANSLDCSGLNIPGGPPLEWVVCLVDAPTSASAAAGAAAKSSAAPPAGPELPPPARAGGSSPPLAAADSAAAAGQGKKKKKSKAGGAGSGGASVGSATPEAAANAVPRQASETSQAAAVGSKKEPPSPQAPAAKTAAAAAAASSGAARTPASAADAGASNSAVNGAVDVKRPSAPPKQAPPPSRTLALPSALIDSWCQFARRSVTHVAEATGFVHFELSFDRDRGCRTVSPEHYIVAFPSKDKGRQRHHSALLTMRVVKEASIPKEYVIPCAGADEIRIDEPEYVEFELLLRVNEAPVQQQLRITAGPVRTNPDTGQRESMRIDLGRCVRQIASEVVDDPRGKRVVQNRWWICIETLRLVCTANSLDCKTLDEAGHPAMEWVISLIDERPPATPAAADNAAPDPEDRDIDELVDFIDGKGGGGKKKKKPKPKEAASAGSPASGSAAPVVASGGACTTVGPTASATVAALAAPRQPPAVAAASATASLRPQLSAEAMGALGAAAGMNWGNAISGLAAAGAANGRPAPGSGNPFAEPRVPNQDLAKELNFDAASRALDGLEMLESLLAGLKSDFATEDC